MPRRSRRPTFSDIAEFMKKMRSTGHYADSVIVRKATNKIYDKKQFVIACLLTAREIRELDCTVLVDFERFLKRLRRINCDDGYLLQGRVVVLMNELHNHRNKHGEARLVDPRGNIRDQLAIDTPFDEFEEPFDYLAEMEDDFVDEFGSDANSYLLIFSHYIPCTIYGHSCAEVLGEFAHDSEHRIYVGYENVYERTDKDEAVEAMKSKGIGMIFPHQL